MPDRPPTIEEIIERRKPRTDTVSVPVDTEIVDRVTELDRRIREERRLDDTENRPPVAPRLMAELDQLEAEAEMAAVEFTFQELPRPDFRALVASHPPVDKGSRWNEDTFAPALVAASCVQPAMTLQQAETIWATWSEAVTFLLFSTAWQVNEGKVKVPFIGRSTERTRGSPPSSTSALEADEPSSTPSS